MEDRTRKHGVTLIEIMVVVAIVGVMSAIAVPSFQTYFRDQRLKQAARSVSDALSLARAEAIRTGRNHIVHINRDPTGAVLLDGAGRVVPVMVVQDDDGTGALPAPNGQVDVGERRIPIPAEAGVNWGVTLATVRAPTDPGPVAAYVTGWSFVTPANVQTSSVLFRPDGIPRAFSIGPYVEGSVGTGGGAVYLTNGRRDYAIVMTPLGGVQVNAWDPALAQWRN